MKMKFLLSTLLLLSVAGPLCAQYLDEPIYLTGKDHDALARELPKQEGYRLDLGSGNQLFIPRAKSYPGSTAGLRILQPTKDLFEAVQKAYDQFKDSLKNQLTIKKLQYVSYNGQVKTIIHQKPASGEKTYFTSEGKMAIIKPTMDSITIARVDTTNGQYRAAVMIFTIGTLSDFSKIANATLVDRFIDSIEAAIPLKTARLPYYKSFIYGHYNVKNDQEITGKLTMKKNAQWTLSLGLSGDIQNIKNRFVPSASVGIFLSNYNLKANNTYHNFGLYWTPYFFFDNDQNGKLKTFRNDFLFATFNAFNGDLEKSGNVNVFLPLSIGYLIHKNGNFLEKNTFGINAFGVKYGNATIKPFIYFNDFFKGVSPSIQLSIGIGK